MDACIILLDTIAMILSIAGAIFNGVGFGIQNNNLMFIGQVIWVCSNGAWINVCYKQTEYKQLAVFAVFFMAALFSVILTIVR